MADRVVFTGIKQRRRLFRVEICTEFDFAWNAMFHVVPDALTTQQQLSGYSNMHKVFAKQLSQFYHRRLLGCSQIYWNIDNRIMRTQNHVL